MSDPLKAYRIEAATRFALDDYDPAARPCSVGDKAADEARLAELAPELLALQETLYAARRERLLLVLQGMDTAGKDGTIRSVFRAVDPLGVRAVSYRVPTLPESQHDFLWRHHRDVPAAGEIAIFNRSHYEAVLVEFVHGDIGEVERQRRFGHIRAFEQLLADSGTTIVKCFLHISREEQRRRLQRRVDDPRRHWKFEVSDLAERARWDDYRHAYQAALAATATPSAPWYVVPADSKSHRNLMVMEILLHALRRIGPRYPPGREALRGIKVV